MTSTKKPYIGTVMGNLLPAALGVISGTIVCMHFLTLFVFPQVFHKPWIFDRMWGIHFISYYPPFYKILFYSLALAICIPEVSLWCCKRAAGTAALLLRFVSRPKKELYFIAIAVVSIFVFRLFNARYALLGDGLVRMKDVVDGAFIRNESGSIFIMHAFYTVLHRLTHMNVGDALALFSNICGGLFIYIVLHLADTLGRSVLEKSAIFTLFILFGTIQHFAGYIEVYALSIVLTTLYLYASILSLRGKMHWLVPTLIFMVSLWCHFIALFTIPSLLYVLYKCLLRRRLSLGNIWTLVIVAGMLLPATIPLVKTYVLPELYPLSITNLAEITLFSPVHFVEYTNGIVLGTGFLLFVTIGALLYALVHRIGLNGEIRFLLITTGSFLFCLFIMRPILGSSDWDTFSYAAIPGNLLGIYLLFYLFRQNRKFLCYCVATTAVLLGLETCAWVGINASREKSVKRFEDITMNDPEYYYLFHPQPLHIACVLSGNHLDAESVRFNKLAYERCPNDNRCRLNYAYDLCNTDVAGAYAILMNLFDNAPEYTAPLRLLQKIAIKTGNIGLTREIYRRMYVIYVNQPELLTWYYSHEELRKYFAMYAEAFSQTGDTIRAREANALVEQMDGASPR